VKFEDCNEIHRCEICNERADPHEIITRATGGPREPWNVIYLCPVHHTMGPFAFHRLGRVGFAIKFPQFRDKIIAACERMGREYDKSGRGNK